MQHIRYERAGSVGVVTLARGKANPMNLEMVRELSQAFDQAAAEAKAVVFTSDRPRFFSGGFDVNEVFQYDRTLLAEFLTCFSRLQQQVLHAACPTVAALPGQTYAGGAILALSCDFRIMATGPYGLALTEVNIGVHLPASIFHLLAAAVGPGHARRMFLTGEPMMAEDALAAGLAYQVVPEDRVTAAAIELAERLAEKPPAAYAQIKQTILSAVGLTPSAQPVTDAEAWFTPEAQEFKRSLAERLRDKSR
jgi:enoyl-CoA hydratase/carnithine racemase